MHLKTKAAFFDQEHRNHKFPRMRSSLPSMRKESLDKSFPSVSYHGFTTWLARKMLQNPAKAKNKKMRGKL